MVNWFRTSEERMFYFINRRLQHHALDRLLSGITHLGGAICTVLISLAIWIFGPYPWKTVGLESLVAVFTSHIPVALIKLTYPRLRPYMVIPGTKTGKNLLTDHSFPSGHTTAIFSLVTPVILLVPMLASVLLPLAFLVAISRIYLGLHYPSDVLAGALLGTAAGCLSVAFVG